MEFVVVVVERGTRAKRASLCNTLDRVLSRRWQLQRCAVLYSGNQQRIARTLTERDRPLLRQTSPLKPGVRSASSVAESVTPCTSERGFEVAPGATICVTITQAAAYRLECHFQ